MESEGQFVRLEVCEKCYQHSSIDSHSQLLFEDAFKQISTLCGQANLKVIKNSPYRYLRKLKDSKLSTKRYLDTSENKIVEFPRRNAFQIYYLNVLIFSRVRTMNFPDYGLIKLILQKLIKTSKEDPLLKGLNLFRSLQLEWKSSHKLDCLYQYIQDFTKGEYDQKTVDQAFKKILSSKLQQQTGKRKIILPYSLYGSKEKQFKMESIYCPNTMRIKSSKTHRNVASKVTDYIRGNSKSKQTLEENDKTERFKGRKKLFDMVRAGGPKIINQNKFHNSIKNEDLSRFQSQTKQIYFSYLDSIKQNRTRQIKTAVARKPHQRLLSAACSKASTRKQQKNNYFQSSLNLRKSQNSNRFKHSENLDSAQSQTIQINLRDSQLQWKNQLTGLNFNSKSNRSGNSGSSALKKSQSKRQQSKTKRQQSENTDRNTEVFQETVRQPFQSLASLNNEDNFQNKSLEFDQNDKLLNNESQKFYHTTRANQLRQYWKLEQQTYNYRQEANVVSRFSCKENFNLELVNNIFRDYSDQSKSLELKQKYVDFTITGQQLTSDVMVRSLRQLYKPQQLKLFPHIFKEVQNYSSNLSQLVNMMLRSNPIIISRIFENKKAVSPFGLYCLWLKNLNGVYSPVFVNDQFVILAEKQRYSIRSKQLPGHRFVYGQICNQNSIWFMILEKAVAKILGGYHNIAGANLSTLMNILMGYPTVDFSHLTLEKVPKIFEQKNFYNKMAAFYAKTYSAASNIDSTIDRVVGFQFNEINPRESRIILRSGQCTNELYLHRFLIQYGEVTLSFFNSFYFLNQLTFKPSYNKRTSKMVKSQLLSCKLFNSHKNNCYFMFNFGKIVLKKPCKASIFKYLSDQEANIVDGMNPLSQQRRRYEYVGQLKKMGDFFFETQLTCGQFVCILEGSFDSKDSEDRPHLTIFSEKEIEIKRQDSYQLQPKQQPTEKQNNKSHSNLKMKIRTPQILIQTNRQQQNTPLWATKTVSQVKNNSNKKFRIKKQFIVDDTQPSDKQNQRFAI